MSPRLDPTFQPKIDHIKSFPGIFGSRSLLEKSDPHHLGVQNKLNSKCRVKR